MGDERAETYLRLLAESEARRAERGSERRPAAEIAWRTEQVRWAGGVLIAAGLLEEDDVRRVAADLEAALLARSEMDRARRANWIAAALTQTPGTSPAHWWGTAQPMRSTLIGRTISVAHERAPSDLHLMTLVRSPDGVAITAAMRMHWPPDGSSADLEIGGAGPEHLPYDQLWAVDDRGTRYRVALTGEGGDLVWQGAIGLHGVPPADARWLDLVADGTQRLVRIHLDPQDIRPAAATEADPVVPPGERMLAEAAERILVGAWEDSGPRADPRLGELITVLAAAGAIAADSAIAGQLAALCQRLGVSGHGIIVPAAAQIPDRWAEVLPPGLAGPAGPAAGPGPGPEWFVPLGPAAADADGTRFAFAGLTTAAGQSFLHVVATGLRPMLAHRWDTGFSWWVRDEAGRWHVAAETDPQARSPGLAGRVGATALRLRLTPPLRARPEQIEVTVTGRRTGVRAVVPVGPGREIADT